ncbi:hypothetical protein PPERSA_13156 [Pseudocohnilembus persalinus]|uniref:Uncharacterized protein n=1 Tax=Pseudocohnilembus persalinus TaxID=266149 RepID=A0A0V0QBJ6_PSEPJ|nr:hypothetical protein PPERSA_13156 [Pseudocohnilembus persalinus]|eukprot:KRW99576.1 hypothetical protein PPERSA_13156 [Pseudocohnilembus persalinus]
MEVDESSGQYMDQPRDRYVYYGFENDLHEDIDSDSNSSPNIGLTNLDFNSQFRQQNTNLSNIQNIYTNSKPYQNSQINCIHQDTNRQKSYSFQSFSDKGSIVVNRPEKDRQFMLDNSKMMLSQERKMRSEKQKITKVRANSENSMNSNQFQKSPTIGTNNPYLINSKPGSNLTKRENMINQQQIYQQVQVQSPDYLTAQGKLNKLSRNMLDDFDFNNKSDQTISFTHTSSPNHQQQQINSQKSKNSFPRNSHKSSGQYSYSIKDREHNRQQTQFSDYFLQGSNNTYGTYGTFGTFNTYKTLGTFRGKKQQSLSFDIDKIVSFSNFYKKSNLDSILKEYNKIIDKNIETVRKNSNSQKLHLQSSEICFI